MARTQTPNRNILAESRAGLQPLVPDITVNGEMMSQKIKLERYSLDRKERFKATVLLPGQTTGSFPYNECEMIITTAPARRYNATSLEQ
ncbi:hypothetical protein PoB_006574800 [Plakobranchus ocellatus]|uniref:Uncharacterized protein n=1 Tax=Plakobranchus ocellatus TaxID=259542 RepID=A0AAV4D547_9GAST|nr:hypothetical protein PoB_006574800 [Plakobranchus ocellatus]